jgi:predicted transcriptional regulator
MEEVSTMTTVLISIKPEHSNNILNGLKTVELRKRGFPKCDRVVMYCTAPVKQIVGEFEVADVITMQPATLWLMYGREACVTEEQFKAYYKGHRWGTAIKIKRLIGRWTPLDPKKLFETFHAPMSWEYLPDERWIRIHTVLQQGHYGAPMPDPRYEPCCPVCKKPLVSELHLNTADERIQHCLDCIKKSKGLDKNGKTAHTD